MGGGKLRGIGMAASPATARDAERGWHAATVATQGRTRVPSGLMETHATRESRAIYVPTELEGTDAAPSRWG